MFCLVFKPSYLRNFKSISETEHEFILDEISCRDALEFLDNSRASDDEETDSQKDKKEEEKTAAPAKNPFNPINIR